MENKKISSTEKKKEIIEYTKSPRFSDIDTSPSNAVSQNPILPENIYSGLSKEEFSSESVNFIPSRCSQLQTVLGATVEDIRKFCHADTVSIMLLDAGTEELTIAYAPKLDHHIAQSVRTKVGEGIGQYGGLI